MSYKDQDAFFAQAYRTGTDRWTQLPLSRYAIDFLKHVSKDGMLLDIGAGRGRIMQEFHARGFRAIGLEKNADLVHKGNAELKAKGIEKSLRFLEGDVLDIPFEDESFDGLVDIGLLHHLKPEDFETYAEETARVLKPHAHACIIVLSKLSANYFDWHPSTADASDFEREGMRYHFFTDDELEELFGGAFDVASLEHDAPEGPEGPVYAVLLLAKK